MRGRIGIREHTGFRGAGSSLSGVYCQLYQRALQVITILYIEFSASGRPPLLIKYGGKRPWFRNIVTICWMICLQIVVCLSLAWQHESVIAHIRNKLMTFSTDTIAYTETAPRIYRKALEFGFADGVRGQFFHKNKLWMSWERSSFV